MREVLSEVAVTVSVWDSAAPAVIPLRPMVCSPESSGIAVGSAYRIQRWGDVHARDVDGKCLNHLIHATVSGTTVVA